jgi:DNA primase
LGRIPDEVIDQLRDRVDVVGLVGRFVTLKKSGRSYKGLCPFHNEKIPIARPSTASAARKAATRSPS